MNFPGGKCSFKNWERMMHIPVVCYADFESILKPCLEGNKTHEHIPCGFCFHLVSPFLQMEPVLKERKMKPTNFPRFYPGIDFSGERSPFEFAKKGNDSPEFGGMEKVSRE